MASYIDEMLDSALSQREKMDFPLILVIEDGNAKRSEKIAALFAQQYVSFYTHTNGEDMDIALQMTAIPEEMEVAVIGLTNPDARAIKNTCQLLRPSHGICLLNEAVSIGLLQALEQIKGVMFIDNDHQNVLKEGAYYNKKVFFAQSQSLNITHHPIEVSMEQNKISFLDDDGAHISTETGIKQPEVIKAMVALGRYFKIPVEKIKHAIQND